MTTPLHRPALALILAMASGCASTTTEYPSLAIRDAERAAGTPVEAAPPAPIMPPRAALDRLAPLLANARAAHAAFTAAAGPTAARVNGAGGSGSESWSAAQVALADLRSHRSTAMIALADLDLIYNTAASAGESTEAIAPVRAQVAAMLAEEDAALDRLIGQLAP